MQIFIYSFGLESRKIAKSKDRYIFDCTKKLAKSSWKDGDSGGMIQCILDDGGMEFIEGLKYSISRIIFESERKGKKKIELYFGCSSGFRRSVYVADRIGKWLKAVTDHKVKVKNLDTEKFQI